MNDLKLFAKSYDQSILLQRQWKFLVPFQQTYPQNSTPWQDLKQH